MVGEKDLDILMAPKCLRGFGVIKYSLIFQNYYSRVIQAGFDTPAYSLNSSSEKPL